MFQVASSLIKAPGGRGDGDGGSGKPTLARQCAEQGVAMVSSSGASLGGFAADEWAYRDVPSGPSEEGLSLESRMVCLKWCVRRRGTTCDYSACIEATQTTPLFSAARLRVHKNITEVLLTAGACAILRGCASC